MYHCVDAFCDPRFQFQLFGMTQTHTQLQQKWKCVQVENLNLKYIVFKLRINSTAPRGFL